MAEEQAEGEGDGSRATFEAPGRTSGDPGRGPLGQDGLDGCQICLGPMVLASDVDLEDPLQSELVVGLECGHAFHLQCLASHVQAKCQEVEEQARVVLQGRDVELGLERGSRQGVLGVARDLSEMHAHGQVRQCPQCGYGPVLNTQCSDMQRHDSNRGYGQGRTTNSCPNCNFFSARWPNWAVWDAADPTTAARCPLCRGRCRLAAGAEIARAQQRIVEADERLKALSERLSEALRRSRWSRHHCEDLIALLLHLWEEAEPQRRCRVHGLEGFGALLALGEAPERFRWLLQGPLRDLLRRRLALEEDSHRHAQSIWDTPVIAGRVEPPSRRSSPAFTMDPTGSLPPPPLSGEDIGRRRHTLNQEILAMALQQPSASSGARGGAAPEADDIDALGQQIRNLTQHRRHLALVLCAAGDSVDAEVAKGLGRPWQPEATVVGGPAALPTMRRDAAERRIMMRRRMLVDRRPHRAAPDVPTAAGRGPAADPEQGPGGRPWPFVIRLLRGLLE